MAMQAECVTVGLKCSEDMAWLFALFAQGISEIQPKPALHGPASLLPSRWHIASVFFLAGRRIEQTPCLRCALADTAKGLFCRATDTTHRVFTNTVCQLAEADA